MLISALFVFRLSTALLVLRDTPPRGFNSFDSYGAAVINRTSALDIARAQADQLLASGYDTFTIDGGWTTDYYANKSGHQCLDAWGRPIASFARYGGPAGMKALSDDVRAMGLKFGLWTIRGVHVDAVALKLPVKGMEQYTIADIVDQSNTGGGKNGSCLWAGDWLGVNTSHPAAQAYYDSRIEALVDQGADFIKADCMFCAPCYTEEMNMFTSAVKRHPKNITLSYSPGGGATPKDGQWVAENTIGTMYRTSTDFHGGWYGFGGVWQAIFIAGNYSLLGLHGANGTFADIDMLPMDRSWWLKSREEKVLKSEVPRPSTLELQAAMHRIDKTRPLAPPVGRIVTPEEQDHRGGSIATLWMIGRYPLFHAGVLPSDPVTLGYLTNPTALEVNAYGENVRAVEYSGFCHCERAQVGCGDYNTNTTCFATFASTVPASVRRLSYAAVAVFNMGEWTGGVSTLIKNLDLPWASTKRTQVSDIWSGRALGTFGESDSILSTLDPHQAAFYRLDPVD